MKILCITDSLGLPREKPQKVRSKETWPNLLKTDFEIQTFSIGGGLMRDFTSQLVYLRCYEPDTVIIQLGIVDCAPRALTKLENHLINKYYITRKLANKLLPRISYFLRKTRKISYTNTKEYEKGLSKIIREFSCKVYCIPILPASQEYEKYLPGIKNKIDIYNLILKRKFGSNYLTLNQFEDSFIMSDNIHLNSEGHKYIAQKIKKHLI